MVLTRFLLGLLTTILESVCYISCLIMASFAFFDLSGRWGGDWFFGWVIAGISTLIIAGVLVTPFFTHRIEHTSDYRIGRIIFPLLFIVSEIFGIAAGILQGEQPSYFPSGISVLIPSSLLILTTFININSLKLIKRQS